MTLITFLRNKIETMGIRSMKILKKLELIVYRYSNEDIANEIIKIATSETQEEINNNDRSEIMNAIIKSIEDMDKNLLKIEILKTTKNNIVDYEIDSYFKNKKISKITKNNIPLVRIKYNESEELYKQIKTNLEDLYKQVKNEYNKPPYERKTLPHQNMFPITNKNNNKYKYKKIYDIHKLKFTCRESNTEGFIGKLCYIKKLIKDFLNINLHEEKKEELLKIMPLIPKIKKIEHNINKQAEIKNRITSIINKKGFVNNLSNTTED